MGEQQVVVVGAGPSGIAAALALKDVGLRPLVLDKADTVGSSWRSRYERLRLNTCRPFSHLPDRRFPKGTPMFPSRDEVIAHIERHANEDGIELRLGTEVDRLERDADDWLVITDDDVIRTREVVMATGYEGTPFTPDWPSRDAFAGTLLHSSEYRNPDPFRHQAVLVVGPGCSGMEIAYDLVEGGAAKVWLSARTPPNIVLRQGPGPVPADVIGVMMLHLPVRVADTMGRFARRMDLGDLTEYGLPTPDEGIMARLQRLGVAPSIVDREVIDAIKAGKIEVVPGVDDLDAAGAKLADGARIGPDVVVCATGYRRGLDPIVGHLDVLDESGAPRALGPDPAAPGLRFIGYVPRPGALGYMGKEAKRAAKAIARELRREPQFTTREVIAAG
jgi:cation diffusion facilitator CzcD-associated flavoprotein CzcO